MNPYEIKNTKNKMKSIAQENAELIKREAKYVLKLNELIATYEACLQAIIDTDYNEVKELTKITIKELKNLRNE